MALTGYLGATEALQNVLNHCWSERDRTGDLQLVGFDGFVRAHRLVLKSACTSNFLASVLAADTEKDDVTKVVIPGASQDLLTRAMAQVYKTMNPTFLNQVIEMSAAISSEMEQVENVEDDDVESCSTLSVDSGKNDDVLEVDKNKNDFESERNESDIFELRNLKQELMGEKEQSESMMDFGNDKKRILEENVYDKEHPQAKALKPYEPMKDAFVEISHPNQNSFTILEPLPPIVQHVYLPSTTTKSENEVHQTASLQHSKLEADGSQDHMPEVKPSFFNHPQPKEKKKKPHCHNRTYYTEESLMEALDLIEDGTYSFSKAARLFKIPAATLHCYRKRKKVNPNLKMLKMGGPGALSPADEKYLIDYLKAMNDFGCPLDVQELPSLVKGILDQTGEVHKAFKDNLPSLSWKQRFKKRPDIAPLVRDKTKVPRLNKELIHHFILNLQDAMAGVPVENILTFAERRFGNEQNCNVLSRRQEKYPKLKGGRTSKYPTVLFAATPDCLLPPFILFPGESVPKSMDDGPDGAVYNHSEIGWLDSAAFDDFFEKIVFPWAKTKPGPKLILGDYESSHFTADLTRRCKKKNIRFISLGLSAKGWFIVQPLENALFKDLKERWKKYVTDWTWFEGVVSPGKEDFPRLLRNVLSDIDTSISENLRLQFKNCGISPPCAEPLLERIEGFLM